MQKGKSSLKIKGYERIELPKSMENLNPSSRYFGSIGWPIGTDEAFCFSGPMIPSQGTLSVDWSYEYKNLEIDNPSSREFGQPSRVDRGIHVFNFNV